MLVRLEIRDFAVISNIVFEPGKGLNVISGETGAGKSLIVDAIGLIMGAKASRNLIRTGSPSAFAEAVFDCSDLNDEGFKKLLEENGIEDDDGMLIISRTVYDSGKSVARVNGTGVTNAVLKDISSRLVDIHGQHDTQAIFDESTHVKLLDRFAGEKCVKLHKEIQGSCYPHQGDILISGLPGAPPRLSGVCRKRDRISRFQGRRGGRASRHEEEAVSE